MEEFGRTEIEFGVTREIHPSPSFFLPLTPILRDGNDDKHEALGDLEMGVSLI